MTVNWSIKPLTTPTILRNCSRCGGMRHFICSYKFRVNAQQRNIDVWLIYKCSACASTWNMAVLSRVRPQDIGDTLYNGFLENSATLAFRYAFDADLFRRNNIRAQYEDVTYLVEGDLFSLDVLKKEDITLHIHSPYNMNLRLDKLLSDRLGLSRTFLVKCLREGAITFSEAGFNPGKKNIILKGDLTLYFHKSAAFER